VWTVACYQIGDLTPSALRDFPDPVEAVAMVAACPDDTHVAAELVASTAEGLRWTAVLRTNDHLAVQLPTPDSASDGSREHPGDLAAALRRWRERLSAWAEGGANGVDGDRAMASREPGGSAAATALPLDVARTPGARGPMGLSGGLDDRLDRLERRVAELVGRRDLDAIDQSISSRLGRLESSVAALSAGIEAANAAAARRDETVRQLEAELVASRADNDRRTQIREELDALQGTIDRLSEIARKLERRADTARNDVRDIPIG
jgi:TolA-binding protein